MHIRARPSLALLSICSADLKYAMAMIQSLMFSATHADPSGSTSIMTRRHPEKGEEETNRARRRVPPYSAAAKPALTR